MIDITKYISKHIDNLNFIIMVLDKNGVIKYINKYFTFVTKYQADEVLEKNWLDIFVDITDKERIKLVFEDIFKSNKTFWEYQNKIKAKDNSIRHILWNNNLIKENNNDFIISIGIDITFQKEMQDKDDILNHQIKISAISETLDNIAHHWRQPLSVISTIAGEIQIKNALDILNKDELDKSCDNIVNKTQELSHIIDDFINIFKYKDEKRSFNIKNTLNKVIKIINKDELTIINNLGDIEIEGFEDELIQVFITLINNAKDIFEKRDIEDKIIIFNSDIIDNYIEISILDSGGGIPLDIIDKIFEPYFTTKHKSFGTGLGLYSAENTIIKYFNGFIIVKNKEFVYNNKQLKGANFIIHIPKNGQADYDDIFSIFSNYNCYIWDKDYEEFKLVHNCNLKLIFRDIVKISNFLHKFNIQYELLENYNIKVFFGN